MVTGLVKLGLASMLFSMTLMITPSLHSSTEEPWDFLQGFVYVPGAVGQIETRHIGALYYNADQELTALVVYPVDCGAEQCALRRPVAFAVFAAGGQMVKFHADPGQETLLSKLLRFQVT
jgi:hypothetical protein